MIVELYDELNGLSDLLDAHDLAVQTLSRRVIHASEFIGMNRSD